MFNIICSLLLFSGLMLYVGFQAGSKFGQKVKDQPKKV